MTRETRETIADFDVRVQRAIMWAFANHEENEDLTPFEAVQGTDTSAAVRAEALRWLEGR